MIGVFDSGFGGLTILKEFIKALPEYDYLYLGDNARAPYGNRSQQAVKEFTEEAVNYLFKEGCSLIIIACNTASSQVLRELQEEYLRTPNVTDKKILGVIRPMVEKVTKVSKECEKASAQRERAASERFGSRGPQICSAASLQKKRIGVVGTRGTINARSYDEEINNINSDIKVFGQACPLLVPLIEEGWSKKPESRMILKKYLRNLKNHNIDTLILGCTHYQFLMKEFKHIMGKKVHIPNPGEVIADSLKEYLKRHEEIDKILSKNSRRTFLTTDNPERFKEIGSQFMGMQLTNIKTVDISSR